MTDSVSREATLQAIRTWAEEQNYPPHWAGLLHAIRALPTDSGEVGFFDVVWVGPKPSNPEGCLCVMDEAGEIVTRVEDVSAEHAGGPALRFPLRAALATRKQRKDE